MRQDSLWLGHVRSKRAAVTALGLTTVPLSLLIALHRSTITQMRCTPARRYSCERSVGLQWRPSMPLRLPPGLSSAQHRADTGGEYKICTATVNCRIKFGSHWTWSASRELYAALTCWQARLVTSKSFGYLEGWLDKKCLAISHQLFDTV